MARAEWPMQDFEEEFVGIALQTEDGANWLSRKVALLGLTKEETKILVNSSVMRSRFRRHNCLQCLYK